MQVFSQDSTPTHNVAVSSAIAAESSMSGHYHDSRTAISIGELPSCPGVSQREDTIDAIDAIGASSNRHNLASPPA